MNFTDCLHLHSKGLDKDTLASLANIGAVKKMEADLSKEADKIRAVILKNPKAKSLQGKPREVAEPEKIVEPAASEKVERKAPRKEQPSKVRTLRGYIKSVGGINFLNFTGELNSLNVYDRKAIAKKAGVGIDQFIEMAIADNWLSPETTVSDFVEALRTDAKRVLSGDRLTVELSEKKEYQKSEAEKKLEKEMAWEPEEPPPGNYVQMKAEDLPMGKELTIIDGQGATGWDVYTVSSKSKTAVKLMDGTEVELDPGEKVEVLKEDLTKKGVVPKKIEKEPLPNKGYIQAKKQSDGKYKLFYRGTRNEIFPDETFRTAREARSYFDVQKLKEKKGEVPFSVKDYRGVHTAPEKDGYAAPGHNLTDMYPDDIYSSKGAQYYGDGSPFDQASISIIRLMRGKPNKPVTIYRAVPKVLTTSERIGEIEKHKAYILKTGKLPKEITNYPNSSEYYDDISGELDKLKTEDIKQERKTIINPGDWVTINKQYAVEHGKRQLQGKYRILQKRVTAKEIFTDANSIHEWGYNPDVNGEPMFSVKEQMSLFDKPKPTQKDIFGETKRKVKEKKIEPKAVFGQKLTERGRKKKGTPTSVQLDLFEKNKKQIQTTMFSVKDKPSAWYSQMEKSVENVNQKAMPAKQWIETLQSTKFKQEGVKQEEVSWSGVTDWLSEQSGKVTKQEVLAYLKENNVQIREVVKGEFKQLLSDAEQKRFNYLLNIPDGEWAEEIDGYTKGRKRTDTEEGEFQELLAIHESGKSEGGLTKFSQYVEPGGENYKEVLLTLPSRAKRPKYDLYQKYIAELVQKYGEGFSHRDTTDSEAAKMERLRKEHQAAIQGEEEPGFYENQGEYTGGHWSEPNVLAHMRLNERTDTEGAKVLFLEEVQSDQAQSLRKALPTRNISKPNSIRKLADDFFGAELSSAVPLAQVDGSVLAVVKNNKILRHIVSLLPVDMVNDLGGSEAAAKKFIGNPALVFHSFPINARSARLAVVFDTAKSVTAGIRAKLLGGLEAGKDANLLPALKASDLTTRDVVSLLAPHSLYHFGLTDKAVRSEITGPGAEKAASLSKHTVRDFKTLPASDAEFLDTPLLASGRAEFGSGKPSDSDGKILPTSVAKALSWHNNLLVKLGTSQPVSYTASSALSMPFSKSWPMLIIKRAVRMAAEGGFDKLGWTPGEIQAARYDLSKQVDELYWNPNSNQLYAYKDGRELISETVAEKDLENTIGKEVARRLLSSPIVASQHGLKGEALSVGGTGMKSFYDKMLVNEVNKFFNKKKWGNAKVVVSEIETERALNEKENVDNVADAFVQAAGGLEEMKTQEIWTLPITPEIKQKALREGMPMFSVKKEGKKLSPFARKYFDALVADTSAIPAAPPKAPSEYERVEDSWFGNKDWSEFKNSVEKDNLQKRIKAIAGKVVFGKKVFGTVAQDIDIALHIYLDLKRNPGHKETLYKDLPKKWQAIVDKIGLIEETPELMAIAKYIRKQGDMVGRLALKEDVIHNQIENHVNRVWEKRKAVSEKTFTDAMQKFKIKSRHAKGRVFETILEGLALKDKNGNHVFELSVKSATSNLQTLKDEISRVIEDKKLISECRKIKREDGTPLIATSKAHPEDIRIEHPNFKVWELAAIVDLQEKETDTATGLTVGDFIRARDRMNIGKVTAITDIGVTVHFINKKKGTEKTVFLETNDVGKLEQPVIKVLPRGKNFFITDEGLVFEKRPLYAPREMAANLNRVLGTTKLKGKFWDVLTKYNAVFKSWILVTSFFHHCAFLRSYYLPTKGKTGEEWNPRKAYKMGKDAIEKFKPELELLVRNGMTMFKMQDWEEGLLRRGSTSFGRYLGRWAKTKAVRDKINNLRERQANFLFGNFGAALKAQAAIIELRNMTRKHPEMDVNERAKMVAKLMNADFGGLHLGRMGRDPTTQHIMRLLLLAPDWTESNVRTIISAVKAGGKEETAMYRSFWASAMMKGMFAVFVANLLLAAVDDDDFWERYKKAWQAGHFRWLDIDITPIYKMLGGKTEARKYFSLFGHFKDPLKFIMHPIRSAHYKGSVVYGMFHEAMSGTDWRGQGFTTLSELIGIDDKGVYATTGTKHKKGEPKGGKLRGKLTTYGGKKGPLSYERVPSYMLSQAIGTQPIQVQNLVSMLTGEVEAFDAIARSLGLHTATTYPPKTENKHLSEFVKRFINIRNAGKSLAGLRKTVAEFNRKQRLAGRKTISWETIVKRSAKNS